MVKGTGVVEQKNIRAYREKARGNNFYGDRRLAWGPKGGKR